MSLAQNLVKIRESRNISQAEFARRTQLSAAYICQIENGRRENLSLNTLMAFCKVLECTLDELLDRKNEQKGGT